MERRKFLIGAGSAAVGASALVGSGAFTSVSANRDVNIKVTGDASAFLAIEAEDTPNADEYVHTESDGTVYLEFRNTDEKTNTDGEGAGSGMNKDASTIFDNLLKFTNQGTQEIRVGEVDPSGHPGSFYAENTQGDGSGSSFDVDDWPEPATKIGVGESITNVGYWISNPEDAFSGDSTQFTVTFKATRVGGNQD
ncbi:hypothetical protein [Natronomonas amylolytica]|uniref:hypothetical protein n=1 Tax=Natronomonas amylolytica TaxID=3108498 RepID=UPI00300A229B